MARLLKVGITHGDINGISYEIILRTLSDERLTEICTPIIFGSAKLIGYFKKLFGIENFRFNIIKDPAEAEEGVVNLVNISQEEFKVDLGIATPEAGRAALLSLDMATEALKNGEIDILVTAPINKHSIQSDDFHFAGHTEYLQDKLSDDSDDKSLMILFNDSARVALVTTHLPLSRLPEAISQEKVLDTITRFDASLRKDFAIAGPRIAVLSLNPHNGDNGLIGNEEKTAIIPAIQEATQKGIICFGPFAADGFFGSGAYRKYDGIVAMYHDQGLAPFKVIADNKGVNFTAGLPFVRTSPDHGTGYDIAGRNIADETSLREAIYKGIDIYRNRVAYLQATHNPLRKQYVEKGADKTVDLTKESL